MTRYEAIERLAELLFNRILDTQTDAAKYTVIEEFIEEMSDEGYLYESQLQDMVNEMEARAQG